MFFSKKTGGFYDTEIHGNLMPEDALEITLEEWKTLLEEQAKGKNIIGDENGRPILQNYVQKENVTLSPIEKLARIGMTPEDIREILGL